MMFGLFSFKGIYAASPYSKTHHLQSSKLKQACHFCALLTTVLDPVYFPLLFIPCLILSPNLCTCLSSLVFQCKTSLFRTLIYSTSLWFSPLLLPVRDGWSSLLFLPVLCPLSLNCLTCSILVPPFRSISRYRPLLITIPTPAQEMHYLIILVL